MRVPNYASVFSSFRLEQQVKPISICTVKPIGACLEAEDGRCFRRLCLGKEPVKPLVTVGNFRLLEFGAKGSDWRAKEEEWKETVLSPFLFFAVL